MKQGLAVAAYGVACYVFGWTLRSVVAKWEAAETRASLLAKLNEVNIELMEKLVKDKEEKTES